MGADLPISVVLLVDDHREPLVDELDSIAAQVARAGGELIEIHLAAGMSESEAWMAGFERSRGPTVAFGRTGQRFAAGWVTSILMARAAGAEAVAGPVRLAEGARLPARIDYLCDYAAFLDPQAGGDGAAASNNVAFDRRLLELARAEGRPLEKWSLLADGRCRVVWRPGMAVTIGPRRSFGAAGLARIARGRQYAGRRCEGWPTGWRGIAGVACLGLPLLLLIRLARRPAVRRRHGVDLVLGLPWLLAALGLWSVGELLGYTFGRRATSGERSGGMHTPGRATRRALAWMRATGAWGCWSLAPASSGRNGPRRPSRRGVPG